MKRIRVLTAAILAAAVLLLASPTDAQTGDMYTEARASFGTVGGTIKFLDEKFFGWEDLYLYDAKADGSCVYAEAQGVDDILTGDGGWQMIGTKVCGRGNFRRSTDRKMMGPLRGYDGYRIRVCKEVKPPRMDKCSKPSPVVEAYM